MKKIKNDKLSTGKITNNKRAGQRVSKPATSKLQKKEAPKLQKVWSV